ncbi:serine/threonine protein kinase [Singulisphaera acidiphila DSM 18658]|uniref:Serine/threonine protein kinase n=2 Tax=Singulisphaera acidiphila TaxID=466153 RepID=L0DFC3_SINAD|nr:serine/threonine protein kinase [Singulisphaera acidiphila DSM 18658]
MVMTPRRAQRDDFRELELSDPFCSEAGPSRRFPVADQRWLPPATSSSASGSFETIVAELTACWDRGERPHVEAFLGRMSTSHPADVVELIYREFCLAESNGLDPDPIDFLRRFPDREVPLNRLFRLHGVLSLTELSQLAEPEFLPEVGDEIGPYILKRELGRGSYARVYLAEQTDLDDRLVVVKISTRLTPEPRLLARARHSHIVEVLWHGTAENGALQLICLPFLGGATLATVLTERRRIGRRPRSGRDLLADLDRVSAPEYPKANLARPAREVVEGLSYPAATAWMVARLAEALDHAYLRGVAHGDIKPSNILLTADGNPMLLDFNLAVGWRLPSASDLPADAGGGTLAYMAPERLRAVAESQRISTPNAADRHRADIFALGVVLLESLTRQSPDLPQAKARTQQEIAAMLAESGRNDDDAMRWLARSSVPRGLRSILARCLAPDRADRYGRASELAEDLDRWRTGRPLAFAEEPPWRFRLGRWARRQRFALAALVLAIVLCATAMTTLWYSFQSTLRKQAEDKLALIWDRDESGVFRFLRFGHWSPDNQEDAAENAYKHLNLYNALGDADWRLRDDVRSLPEPERSELEVWLLEQILRYTRALGERQNSPDDWRRAQALLEQVVDKMPLGPLQSQRRRLLEQLDKNQTGATLAPTATPQETASRSALWMEDYLLGIEAEPRHARAALAHYQAVLKARPRSFWGHYRAATVAFRLGDQTTAAEHLRQCISQRPRNVALRAQLAGCLFMMGRYDTALEACTKALEIDPDHAVSTRNQTFVRRQLGQEDRVDSDVRRFELLTRSQSEVLSLKTRLESMHTSDLDWSTPTPNQVEPILINAEANDLDTRVLRATQLRHLKRFDEALLELDQILSLEPEHLEARLYRAMLLRKLNRHEAISDFAYLVDHPRLDELIPQYKDAINIYHQRTSDLLRANQPKTAIKVALDGLAQANRFQSMVGESHYALARAYASAAKSDPSLIPQVAKQLKAAYKINPKILATSFEEDQNFTGLRDQVRPVEFKRR